jgi:hypothetical protein
VKRSGFVLFEGPTPEAPTADPAPTGGRFPPEAVVLNFEDYDVVREEIPRTGRRTAERILTHLMNSYIPENPGDYAMDFRLQHRGRRSLATLVIIKKDRLSAINARYPGTPLWIPPDEKAAYNLDGIVMRRDSDSAAIEDRAPVAVRPDTPEFLDNLYFPATGRSRPARTWGLALLAVLPFAVLFSWSAVEKQKRLALAREAANQKNPAELAEKIGRLENIREELSGEREVLVAGRPVNAASFLDILALEAPGMEIQSLSLQGRNFSIRARFEDPVSVMKALSGSPFFADVNLSDMRPIQGASLKSFTLKGIYHGP